MSSLRNAVQRRNHKERAQPTERSKWGLLEKRKDYKLRAADHKLKKRKLHALKEKASERNEDEFYFGMVNASTVGGIKRSKRLEDNSGGGGKSLPVEVVKLMKTQDQGYLQTMLQKTKRERERCEQDLLVGETGVRMEPSNGRVVFDENMDDEVLLARPTTVVKDTDDFDMDLDGLDEDDDSGSEREESDDEGLTPEEKLMKSRKRHALAVKRRRLRALREQEEKLSAALDAVEEQRARMNGTIGGTNKNGVTFKPRQRKR